MAELDQRAAPVSYFADVAATRQGVLISRGGLGPALEHPSRTSSSGAGGP